MVIEGGEEGVLDVECWAELRREHFVGGVSIKELARRHGIDRNTVRRALRSDAPPVLLLGHVRGRERTTMLMVGLSKIGFSRA